MSSTYSAANKVMKKHNCGESIWPFDVQFHVLFYHYFIIILHVRTYTVNTVAIQGIFFVYEYFKKYLQKTHGNS